LIGGVLILQTLPPIVLGLLTRRFHPWALLCGWAAGMASGLIMLYDTPNPLTGKEHFGGAQYALSHFGFDNKTTVYTGILALLANIAVTLVASLLLRVVNVPHGGDETRAEDYAVEAGDPALHPLPATPAEETVVART
jgi:SSS family solute:Na+ symporter